MAASSVAVVIPVFNRPNAVLDALRGVLAQTHRPRRVVVVDDGSTDGTAEAVEGWLRGEGAELAGELIRQENAGVSVARNRGAEAAGPCDLLAFLDSDDIWPGDYLERAVAAFEAEPAAVAATADRLDVDEQTGERRLQRRDWIASRTPSRIFLHTPPGLSNTVFRAAAFHKLGGYDPAMRRGGEDYHMQLRMSLLGGWLHLPGEPVTYRKHTVDSPDPQQQLSRQYDDRRLHLARMLQRFIDEEGGAEVIEVGARRRRLGRVWYSAGRALRRLGRTDEAAECFERAVELQPWHLRARVSRLAVAR